MKIKTAKEQNKIIDDMLKASIMHILEILNGTVDEEGNDITVSLLAYAMLAGSTMLQAEAMKNSKFSPAKAIETLAKPVLEDATDSIGKVYNIQIEAFTQANITKVKKPQLH